MKADKNVVVHNSVKELYDSIYEIFKEIGASSSLLVKILDIIFISVPIGYLIADYFKPVYSFIFLIVWFVSTIKIRELSLLKNCLIYTKIKYDLKDEEKIPSNKISTSEDCAKQN